MSNGGIGGLSGLQAVQVGVIPLSPAASCGLNRHVDSFPFFTRTGGRQAKPWPARECGNISDVYP